MKVRKFRILRLRHHVSMVELGRACGVSAQRISELELSENKPSAETCLLYTSPSPRDRTRSRMPSSA